MLMSAYELALSDDHEGIIELPDDAPVGARYVDYAGLGDPVIDIKVTPNRADCLGVRGIARDLAAAGVGTLKPLDETPVPGKFTSPIGIHLTDRKACPLFLGRHIRGLKNGPSPRLAASGGSKSIGLRPISALVDITNFLTFDLNRPLHVFDAGKVKGDLVVRFARPGEKLLALNGREYALDPEITAIADDNGVQSLGGVIGGEPTSCTEDDHRSVYRGGAVRSRCAPPRPAAGSRSSATRATASSAASTPNSPRRVSKSRRGWCSNCAAASRRRSSSPAPCRNGGAHYVLRPDRVAGARRACTCRRRKSTRILEALGFAVAARTATAFAVTPPSWRGDIVGEADLVEEVLRVKGYDEIPPVPLPRETVISAPGDRPAPPPHRAGAPHAGGARPDRGGDLLVHLGRARPSASAAASRRCAWSTRSAPISTRCAPRCCPTCSRRRGATPIAASPTSRCSRSGRSIATTRPRARPMSPPACAPAGSARATGARSRGEPDLYAAKEDALAALAAAGAPVDNHPGLGRAAGLVPSRPRRACCGSGRPCSGISASCIPEILDAFDVKGPVAAFEVFHRRRRPAARRAAPRPPLRLSVFQPVERDFAFIVDRDVPAETLLRAARGVDRKLVTDIRLFDVYEGKGLPDGKKSLAIAVTLQPQDATLTDAEIEAFSQRLVAAVEKATGGTLRG